MLRKVVYLPTPLGQIGIAENGRAITNIFFGKTVVPKDFIVEETPLLKEASRQLLGYFNGTRNVFHLPIEMEGTDFERSVWKALGTIPYGETRTYSDIARMIGHPNGCRAVGRANSKNPLSIIVPCHRVIGVNGKLTGYAGGLDMKKRLLQIEGVILEDE